MVRIAGADELPLLPSRLPIYFSPEPPPLGAVIDRIALLYVPTWDAPAELSHYVGEPFYAALGSQLAENNLSGKQRRRLEAYRSQRDDARRKLRGQLGAEAWPSGPSTCEALEAEANELRRLLYAFVFDYNRHRTFRIASPQDDLPPGIRRMREYRVLRAAAYFLEGLSPAQRRLLLEYTIELNHPELGGERQGPQADPGAVVFFLPETARIPVPPDLPAAVRDKFTFFLRKKEGVKQEIAAEVIRLDGSSDWKRERGVRQLAERQAPIIAELEAEAESLRHALAPYLEPEKPSLPPETVKLATEYLARRQALQEELRGRLQAERRELLTYAPGLEQLRWDSTLPSGGYTIGNYDGPGMLAAPAVVNETIQQQQRPRLVAERMNSVTARFAKDMARETAAIEEKRRALFNAAAQALGIEAEGELSPAIVEHVQAELRKIALHSRRSLYADYHTAVLRPGLTPADRRLLFNSALENLALPLPPAVRRPVGRFE